MLNEDQGANALVLVCGEAWVVYCGLIWFSAYSFEGVVGGWIDAARPYFFAVLMAAYAISAALAANQDRLRAGGAVVQAAPFLAGVLFFAFSPLIIIGYFPLSLAALALYIGLLVFVTLFAELLTHARSGENAPDSGGRRLLAGTCTAGAAIVAVLGLPVLLEDKTESVRQLAADPIFRGRVAQFAESYGMICTGVAAVAVWDPGRSWFSDIDDRGWRASMRLKGGIGLGIGLLAAVLGEFGGRMEAQGAGLLRAGSIRLAAGDLQGAEASFRAALAACPACLAAPARLAELAARRGEQAAFKELSLSVGAGVAARRDAASAANLPALTQEDEQALASLKELLIARAAEEAPDLHAPLAMLPRERRLSQRARCDGMGWKLESLRLLNVIDPRVFPLAGGYESACVLRYQRAEQLYGLHAEARVFDDEASAFSGPLLLSQEYVDALLWFSKVGARLRAPPAPRGSDAVGQWFQDTAALGDPVSAFTMGELLRLGQGWNKDAAAALRAYAAAAEQGYTPAMARLARMLETGDGVPKDMAQAYVWIQLADAHSHVPLGDGELRIEHEVSQEENAAAVRELDRRARGGDWYAFFKLHEWKSPAGLRKAAEEGVPAAQRTLGERLDRSGADPEERVAWLEKAAEHYDCDAMVELGQMLREGRGVARDALAGIVLLGTATKDAECSRRHADVLDRLGWLTPAVEAKIEARMRQYPAPYDWGAAPSPLY